MRNLRAELPRILHAPIARSSRREIINAQRQTPSLIEGIQHALRGEFRLTGSWSQRGSVVSGASTSVGVGGVLSGAEAREQLAEGVRACIAEGAKRGGNEAARIVADALRQIPGLIYPGPQTLGQVLAEHPGV